MNVAFNFRQTSGYVTDVGVESPVLNEAYPTTYANGATAGWESTYVDPYRDRDNSIDRRLAGHNRVGYVSAPVDRDFRCDLDAAGAMDLHLAVGDPLFGYATNQVNPYAKFVDTSSVLFTVVAGDTSIAAGEFYDATGVKRTSPADWVANQAVKSLTFSTTILRMRISAITAGEHTPLTHLAVATAAGGSTLWAQSLM